MSETVKMTKYTKIEQMVQRSALKKLFLGPLRRASGQKVDLFMPLVKNAQLDVHCKYFTSLILIYKEFRVHSSQGQTSCKDPKSLIKTILPYACTARYCCKHNAVARALQKNSKTCAAKKELQYCHLFFAI